MNVRLPLILCYAGMATLSAAVSLLPVFLTTLSADLGGLSEEQLGRIGAVTIGGLVVGIVASGPLADRYGVRVFAVLGNALTAAGLVWLALAHTYDGVLAASGLMGAGCGFLDMVLSPTVAALQPDRRTAAMNLLHSFFCTGQVAIIGAGALVLKFGLGWRRLAAGLAVWPVVVAAGFWAVPLPTLIAEGDVRTPVKTLATHAAFWLAIAAIFLGGATEVGMAYWLPAYAERVLRFTPFGASLGLMGFTLAMAVGRLGILALPTKLEPVRLMLVCCGASVVLFTLAATLPGGAALAACVAAGLAGSCLWPSVLATTADRFPAGGATLFAILAATGNAGAMVMPWAIGGVADRAGLRWGLAAAAVCPLLMIGVLLAMRPAAVATPAAMPEPAV